MSWPSSPRTIHGMSMGMGAFEAPVAEVSGTRVLGSASLTPGEVLAPKEMLNSAVAEVEELEARRRKEIRRMDWNGSRGPLQRSEGRGWKTAKAMAAAAMGR